MQNGKSKDWVLFPYDASNEKAIKIDFSGNTLLANGEKGTLLGDYVKVFAQSALKYLKI